MEYSNRTQEQVELWLQGSKIIREITGRIFSELEQVNAHSTGVEYANSHVELVIGISVDLMRKEIQTALLKDSDPEAIKELIWDKLQEAYNEMINENIS